MAVNYSYCLSDLKSFYKSLGELNFKGTTARKILELRYNSKELNRIFRDFNIYVELSAPQRYAKIANKIKTNPKGYGATNNSEMALLFMFSIDPNFEAAIIYGESNTTKEIKEKMMRHFGLYDSALIELEKHYINNFLGPKKTNEIEEEIDRRIYK